MHDIKPNFTVYHSKIFVYVKSWASASRVCHLATNIGGISKILCILVVWMKVALALEGLISTK